MPRKTDSFYKAYIPNEGYCRQSDGSGEPVPGEEGGEEEKSIVLHLKFHEYSKGNKKYKGEKYGIQQRPEDAQGSPFIFEGHLLLGKKPE
jgi:hypothetical protein